MPAELEHRIRQRWAEYDRGLDYLSEEKRELLTVEKLSQKLPDV